jgi:hypothetical protein
VLTGERLYDELLDSDLKNANVVFQREALRRR